MQGAFPVPGGPLWETLYTHPRHLTGYERQYTYEMRDDIFSLGICLLEIALWKSLFTWVPGSPGSFQVNKDVIDLSDSRFRAEVQAQDKPTTFATIPAPPGAAAERVPLFALPGNPASALVTFHIFVIPALRRLGGWPEARCRLPSVRVQIQESMRLDPRPEYHRALIRVAPEGLKAYSTGGQRSSRVASLKGANGLVALPPRVEGGASKLEIGDYVEAIVIGELQME